MVLLKVFLSRITGDSKEVLMNGFDLFFLQLKVMLWTLGPYAYPVYGYAAAITSVWIVLFGGVYYRGKPYPLVFQIIDFTLLPVLGASVTFFIGAVFNDAVVNNWLAY